MITLKDLWFRYPGSGSWVLEKVNLRLPQAGLYYVMGPNGIGKTTLLKVISLLYKPTRGTIEFMGQRVDWRQDPVALRRRIVYVHETPVMFRGTVRDNVLFPLRIRGEKDGATAEKVASYFGLEDILDHDARRLSRGQQQLVALARALVVNPDVLVLDEPLSHLSWSARSLVARILYSYSRDNLVVIATHDTYLPSKTGEGYILMDVGSRVTVTDKPPLPDE